MNRKVLDELANWMIDCLIGKDIIKSNKIDNVVNDYIIIVAITFIT